jgi:ferritin-like protein
MKKESSRVVHVNFTMNSLYGLLAELYEAFIDDDRKESQKVIKVLTRELKQLSNALDDEMQDL